MNLSADVPAQTCNGEFSWFPSPPPAAQQPVTKNPKKSSGKRQHYLQRFQAVKHQLLTVPPALLTFWGLWDSKTICLVVSAVGILPVLTIPVLVVPTFVAIPAITVIAIATAHISKVPAFTVAMVVAMSALSVAVNVTVATASFSMALHIIVATTTLSTAWDLIVATVPVVVVSFSDNAATTTATTTSAAAAATTAASSGNTGAAAAFSIVGAGICVVEALYSDTWKGGNATQIPCAGETWNTLCCCGGCNWAVRICSILLC